MSTEQPELANLIWSLADLLRGDYRQPEYGQLILPSTVLRSLDWVLELTGAVPGLARYSEEWL